MFSNLYTPIASGSSVQSSSLSRELVRRGHRVTVITARVLDDTPERETLDGVEVHRIPAFRLPRMSLTLNFPWISYTFTPRNQRRIREILQECGPSVLHLHNHMFDLSLSAVRMRAQFHKPLVITIHTILKHARRMWNLLLCPADRLLLRHLVVNKADALICPDVNIEQYVSEAFPNAHTQLIPYGIDIPHPPSGEAICEIKHRYNLAGKRVILSLGHVHEVRNRKELVEALPEVLKVFPNTVLLVVGAVSTDSPSVLARRLGVEGSVVFTGPLPHSQVPALLAAADLEAHWLNQDVAEMTSLGIATLEAMGAGKAVVTVANQDTHGPGVIRNGENLVLVSRSKPGEITRNLIKLLADEERRKVIGAAASKTVREHFSWDVVCERTVDLYAALCKSSLGRGPTGTSCAKPTS